MAYIRDLDYIGTNPQEKLNSMFLFVNKIRKRDFPRPHKEFVHKKVQMLTSKPSIPDFHATSV